MKMYSTVAVFLVACCIVSAEISHPQKRFKTNCFSDYDDKKCESSWVKICGDYYACDMLIHFDHSVKRIGYSDDKILVASGSETFVIDEYQQKAEKTNRIISPWGEIVDKYGNKYYALDGTTFVGLNGTGKEIEIITTKGASFNQLALDPHANKLFILAFKINAEKDRKVGTLYAITLDPLPIENGKIYAEQVEEDDKMTAMAVQGSLERLLLGATTEHGGRLIRLNRLKEDPCSTKSLIFNVLDEAGYSLLKAVEESSAVSTRGSFNKVSEDNSKTLELENSKLKRELNQTNAKFDLFSNKLQTFTSKINVASSSISEVPTTSSRDGDTQHQEEKVCLPKSEVEFMRHQIESLKETEKELHRKLQDFSKDLASLINDSEYHHL